MRASACALRRYWHESRDNRLPNPLPPVVFLIRYHPSDKENDSPKAVLFSREAWPPDGRRKELPMSSEEPDQEEPPRRLPVSGPLNQPEQPYPSRDRDAGTSDASGLIVPGEEVEPKPRRAVRLTDRDRRILTLLTLLGVMDARQLQVHFTRLSPITHPNRFGCEERHAPERTA